jgi:hypothetical protein
MTERATKAPQHELDWSGLLSAALEIPGSVGNSFRRLYNYSMSNCAFLYMQGVAPQPVATYNRWKEVDRHVKRGASGRYIIRPITVKLKDELDETGQPKTLTRFKPVKAVFPISDTEGEPLPDMELPEWSRKRALGALSIREVAFEHFNGNIAGYSHGRDLAINPVAVDPELTWFHEAAHILHGHTTERQSDHQGVVEFEAEGSSYLVGHELGVMNDAAAERSRGYLQGWLGGVAIEPKSIRSVFKVSDQIVTAGRVIPTDVITIVSDEQ